MNPERKTAIIILILAVLLGGALFFYRKNNQLEIPREQDRPQNANSKNEANLETKTDNQANVSMAVTPLDVPSGKSEWKFNVVMNTHTVELDQDLTKSAVLTDDQGRKYEPIRWEGPVGGHHREGLLVFKAVDPAPKSIELKISGIAGITRNFFWNLNL